MQYPDKYPAGSFTFADDIRPFGEYASDYTLENLARHRPAALMILQAAEHRRWSSFCAAERRFTGSSYWLTAGNEMTKVLFHGLSAADRDYIRAVPALGCHLTVDQQITKGIKIRDGKLFSHSRQQYGNLFENSATSNPVSRPTIHWASPSPFLPTTHGCSASCTIAKASRANAANRYLGSFYGEIETTVEFPLSLNM